MSLAPCRECGENVSTAAPTCPQCGVRHPDQTQANRAATSSYFLGALLVVLFLGALLLITEMLGV